MKKENAISVNEWKVLHNLAFFVMHQSSPYRLYTCNARIYKAHTFFVLESYNSPVAIYFTSDKVLCEFPWLSYGKCTHTTAYHMNRFKKLLIENGYEVSEITEYRYTY